MASSTPTRLNNKAPATPPRTFDLHADNASPQDIWSDGTTMWVADGTYGKLYAYNLSGGTRDTTREFDTLDTDNRHPGGASGPTGPPCGCRTKDRRQALRLQPWTPSERPDDREQGPHPACRQRRPLGPSGPTASTMWVADSDRTKSSTPTTLSQQSARRQPGTSTPWMPTPGAAAQMPSGPTGVTMWVVDLEGRKALRPQPGQQSARRRATRTSIWPAANPILFTAYGPTAPPYGVSDTVNAKIYSFNFPASDNADLKALTLSGLTLASTLRRR